MNRERLEAEWARNFAERGELGAGLSVWQHGQEIVNLAGGWADRHHTVPWTAETPVLVWSTTKGMAAACVLQACERLRVPLSRAVSTLWPEFGAAGKGGITIGEVLSHQAGLAGLDAPVPVEDRAAVLAAICRQAPSGDRPAYHPRTFGFLAEELVERLTGVVLREYWRREFAEPMGLDFWFGVPAAVEPQVATMVAARTMPPKDDPFLVAFSTPGTAAARAFNSVKGLQTPAAMNTPEGRMAGHAGFGGIGTARAVAKFYGMLASSGEMEGRRYFAPATLQQMETTLVQGWDSSLVLETAFAAGFMRDPVDGAGRKVREIFGPSARAFGQPGAGGSHALADPAAGIGFAYVMNQMEFGVLPGRRALALVEAVFGA